MVRTGLGRPCSFPQPLSSLSAAFLHFHLPPTATQTPRPLVLAFNPTCQLGRWFHMRYPPTTSYMRGKSSFRASSSLSPPPHALLDEEAPEAEGATRYKRKIIPWKTWQKEIHVYFHYDSWFLSLSSLFHRPCSVPLCTTPTAALCKV